MLSLASRLLLCLLILLDVVVGAIAFAAPEYAAANFPWSVSPLIAITIGGWLLGNAWVGAASLRRPFGAAFAAIFYLVLFGTFETIILFAFRERISLGSPLAWLYVLGIAANFVFGISAIVDWLRSRPVVTRNGQRLGMTAMTAQVIFLFFVGGLAVYVLTRPPLIYGGVFPDPMSAFTLRSFGAFYLAVALGTVPLLFIRQIESSLTHSFANYGLILFITLAAFRFIDRFDFAAHPGQLIYIGAYVAVGVVTAISMIRHGTGRASDAMPATVAGPTASPG